MESVAGEPLPAALFAQANTYQPNRAQQKCCFLFCLWVLMNDRERLSADLLSSDPQYL